RRRTAKSAVKWVSHGNDDDTDPHRESFDDETGMINQYDKEDTITRVCERRVDCVVGTGGRSPAAGLGAKEPVGGQGDQSNETKISCDRHSQSPGQSGSNAGVFGRNG